MSFNCKDLANLVFLSLTIYTAVVGYNLVDRYISATAFEKYDLNGDGVYNENEVTPKQIVEMKNASSFRTVRAVANGMPVLALVSSYLILVLIKIGQFLVRKVSIPYSLKA